MKRSVSLFIFAVYASFRLRNYVLYKMWESPVASPMQNSGSFVIRRIDIYFAPEMDQSAETAALNPHVKHGLALACDLEHIRALVFEHRSDFDMALETGEMQGREPLFIGLIDPLFDSKLYGFF